MGKKTIIDWKMAAKDRVPCYFWDGKRPEEPEVQRLWTYKLDLSSFEDINCIEYKNCEIIRTEDKEKYTKTVWEGRENFIQALKERKPMKVRVTSELSRELQEIAFENGVVWQIDNEEKKIHNECATFLYFTDAIRYNHDEECFLFDKYEQYFPETDKFEEPEQWRPCETREEFRQFLGKIALSKDDKQDLIECLITHYYKKGTWSGKWWFENYELLEPFNGSKVIGVRV